MPMTTADLFDNLDQVAEDPGRVLDQLIEHFRQEQKPHELFEALKLRVRHRLGLPLHAEQPVDVDSAVDRQLEDGLIEACREVGTMLLRQGNVRDGWMFMRPVGDRKAAAQLLSEIEPDDDNVDDFVQVLLHEAVDIGRGYQMVLQRMGTCNSITMLEQSIAARPRADQQIAAALLLDHVYGELIESVRADITRREGTEPPDQSLVALLENRRQLFAGGAYHLDTTHLASTVRFARVLEEPQQIHKAWELTQYGRQLQQQLQYPGDEPFVDFYPAHALFFAALDPAQRDEKLEQALRYFEKKAREVDSQQEGTGAIETYLELLRRTGNTDRALEVAPSLIPPQTPPPQAAAALLQLSTAAGSFDVMKQYCREHDDLLGYASALVTQHGGRR